MFEKDELNLSLKSLQEEHNKILQQNEVSVYQAQRGLVLLFIEVKNCLCIRVSLRCLHCEKSGTSN